MRRQVESWRRAQVTDDRAKLIRYSAFIEGNLVGIRFSPP
jgi:hypothetical protein